MSKKNKQMTIRVRPDLATQIKKIKQSETAWGTDSQVANAAIAAGLPKVKAMTEVES